jgi:hypothetical protein
MVFLFATSVAFILIHVFSVVCMECEFGFVADIFAVLAMGLALYSWFKLS